jgi:hypothetical protein
MLKLRHDSIWDTWRCPDQDSQHRATLWKDPIQCSLPMTRTSNLYCLTYNRLWRNQRVQHSEAQWSTVCRVLWSHPILYIQWFIPSEEDKRKESKTSKECGHSLDHPVHKANHFVVILQKEMEPCLQGISRLWRQMTSMPENCVSHTRDSWESGHKKSGLARVRERKCLGPL